MLHNKITHSRSLFPCQITIFSLRGESWVCLLLFEINKVLWRACSCKNLSRKLHKLFTNETHVWIMGVVAFYSWVFLETGVLLPSFSLLEFWVGTSNNKTQILHKFCSLLSPWFSKHVKAILTDTVMDLTLSVPRSRTPSHSPTHSFTG